MCLFCPHVIEMRETQFGEIVLDHADVCDLVMQGHDVTHMDHVTVESDIDLERLRGSLPDLHVLDTWQLPEHRDITVQEFDRARQSHWYMPEQYQHMDIATHVLDLCQDQVSLQRVGQELLLFQQHDLFDLLRYLVYLVDTMQANNVIWGVGRGSSVSSYVLYLLGVHRINSLYYDLDIREFLR